jgi:hypothetical protein
MLLTTSICYARWERGVPILAELRHRLTLQWGPCGLFEGFPPLTGKKWGVYANKTPNQQEELGDSPNIGVNRQDRNRLGRKGETRVKQGEFVRRGDATKLRE